MVHYLLGLSQSCHSALTMIQTMLKLPQTLFNCPHCGIAYKVVPVEVAQIEPSVDTVECLNCGGELDAREGAFMRKYFLVGPSRGARRKK